MSVLRPSTFLLPLLLVLSGCYAPYRQQPASPANIQAAEASDPYALSPPPDLLQPRDESRVGPFHRQIEGDAPSVQAESGDLWARLRNGFSLPRERSEVFRAARQLAAGQKHLNGTLQNGEAYLWHMVEAVEARGFPLEIALLPAIESAYNPYAYSPSHAVGLWQFLPGTGERFGLRRNWWYDGRRDVTESTRAALDYLAYLHGMFDDWLLALAAYNSGEGRVMQAQKNNRARGRPEDFWSLSLPSETRRYVPRLLGMAELMSRPEHYGLMLQPLKDEPRFEIVELPGQVELELAAELIDLEPEVLHKLNPGFHRWATDPNGPHRLLVPDGQGKRLRDTLAALPPEDHVRWQPYIVEAGDSLSSIAHRHAVQAALLREVNELAGDSIIAGTVLRVPRVYARNLKLPEELQHTAHLTRTTYIIQPGDSLWKIARRHGVRMKDLARWNNLSLSATLQPGRKLVIHGTPKTTDT